MNSLSLEEQIKINYSNWYPSLPEINIIKLAGDASSRVYFRVAAAGQHHVVCFDPNLSAQETPRVLLLQKVLSENHVRVPKFPQTDKASNVILQEDLGDHTLLLELASASLSHEYEWLKKSIDEMIKIHSIDVSKYGDVCFARESFDLEKLMWEVNFTLAHFIRGYLRHDLSPADEKYIHSSYEKICTALAKGSMVLVHRDFHARNIMIKSKKPVLIDFQDARMGVPQYDLVSLLEDCYYRYHPDTVMKVKDYYYKKFICQKKLFKTRKEFEYFYNLAAIQRIFKAIGSFSYFAVEKQNPRYIKYIGYSFENLKSFLSQDPQWDKLRRLLGRIYYAG